MSADTNKNNKLELWIEYEKIAMHFNSLLIQLRMRALGGLGAIIALIGFSIKTNTTGEVLWSLLSSSFFILTIAWGAIFILDYFYYNKLLLGAVTSIVKLEELEEGKDIPITFSNSIKDTVEIGNEHKNLWSVIAFYFIIFSLLFVATLFSALKLYSLKT